MQSADPSEIRGEITGKCEDKVATLQIANDPFAALQAQADSPANNAMTVAEKNAASDVPTAQIRGRNRFVSF